MDISFGYTWPAAVAGRKTKTRRYWKASHAKKFRAGMEIVGIDRDRRAGGQPILRLSLTIDPYLQPISEMPDSDYEAEGFAYLNENKHLIPMSMPYNVSRAGFEEWRRNGSTPYVVEFKILEVFPIGIQLLEEAHERGRFWETAKIGADK